MSHHKKLDRKSGGGSGGGNWGGGVYKAMVGGCCVCSEEQGWDENPLVYCDGDGCSVAVHKHCYGIIKVPAGSWFCRKCESQERAARVKCELCPMKTGALKRTDTGSWAHVVCALYIPEVSFKNVETTMEPIILSNVPSERFLKTCAICEDQGKESRAAVGACMACSKTNCKTFFHVTCAQSEGLLCEEQNTKDVVTYCGYCPQHYRKVSRRENVKVIPPFRDPEFPESTPESSPEKSADGGNQASFSHSEAKKTTKEKCIAAAGLGKAVASGTKEVALGAEPTSGPSSETTLPVSSASSSTSAQVTSAATASSSCATKFTTANFTEAKVTPVVQNSVLLNLGRASLSSSPTPNHSRDNSSGATDDTEAAATTTTTTSVSSSIDAASAKRRKSIDGSSDESHASSRKSKKKRKKKSDSHHHHRERETFSQTKLSGDEEEEDDEAAEKLKTKESKSAPNLTTGEGSKISQQELLSKLKPTSVVLNQLASSPQPGASSPSVSSTSSASATSSTIVTTKPVFTVVQRPSGSFSSTPPLRSLSPASPPPQEMGDYLGAPPRSSVLLCNSGVSVASASSSITSFSSASTIPFAASGSSGENSSTPQTGDTTPQNEGETPRQSPTPRETPINTPNTLSATEEEEERSRLSVDNDGGRERVTESINDTPETPPAQCDMNLVDLEVAASITTTTTSATTCTLSSNSGTKKKKKKKNSVGCEKRSEKSSKSSSTPKHSGSSSSSSQPSLAHSGFSPSSSTSSHRRHHDIPGPVAPTRREMDGDYVAGKNASTNNGSSAFPTSLDQLLEQHWDLGNQFMMNEAEHFDIATLLQCLYQLRQENNKLESHAKSLQARREHLLAVNARLRNSLSSGTAGSSVQSSSPSATTPMMASNYTTSGYPASNPQGLETIRSGSSSAFSNSGPPSSPPLYPDASLRGSVEKKEFKTPQHTAIPDSKDHLKIFNPGAHQIDAPTSLSSSIGAARGESPKSSPSPHQPGTAFRTPAHFSGIPLPIGPLNIASAPNQYPPSHHDLPASALQHMQHLPPNKLTPQEAAIWRQQQLMFHPTPPFTELKDPRSVAENPSEGVEKLLLQEQFRAALTHGDAVVLQQQHKALATALASAAVGSSASSLNSMSQQQLQQLIPALNPPDGMVFQMFRQPVTDLSQRPPSHSPRK